MTFQSRAEAFGTLRYRLLQKIKSSVNGCWEWTGAKCSGGYGCLTFEMKMIRAHRASYEEFRGEIPKGMVIDHLCRNRGCINPNHLEVVDNRTNCLRGIGPTAKNFKKTHCPKGHAYKLENIYFVKRGNHFNRLCKTCVLAKEKAKREKWIK